MLHAGLQPVYSPPQAAWVEGAGLLAVYTRSSERRTVSYERSSIVGTLSICQTHIVMQEPASWVARAVVCHHHAQKQQ